MGSEPSSSPAHVVLSVPGRPGMSRAVAWASLWAPLWGPNHCVPVQHHPARPEPGGSSLPWSHLALRQESTGECAPAGCVGQTSKQSRGCFGGHGKVKTGWPHGPGPQSARSPAQAGSPDPDLPATLQAQHEAEGPVHLSLQWGLPHHQGQPASLPSLPAQALHRHRHDERM